MITTENIHPSSPPPWAPTHTHLHPYFSPNLYNNIHTPLLIRSSTRHSHTRTSLDLYTGVGPNQKATLVAVEPHRMVKTVQMADHALLRIQTAVGIK